MNTEQVAERVSEIYRWLDEQIRQSHTAGTCSACGKCCDFAAFDHLLFVSTPELIYLKEKLEAGCIKPMINGRCPYNAEGKCTIYEHRFTGCRIFCCKGKQQWQNQLSEQALCKFKSLCDELGLAYRYVKLAEGLNCVAGVNTSCQLAEIIRPSAR